MTLPTNIPTDGEEKEITVLLTGFGPFKTITTNPSWSIVSSLPATMSLDPTTDSTRIRLVTHPDPVRVSYSAVRSLVSTLYASHPHVDYVIHVGVASRRKCYAVERMAHRAGYEKEDVDGELAKGGDACGEGWPEVLRSSVDVDGVLKRWRELMPDVDLHTSDDAGRYLCEFIYYCSLAYFWEKGGKKDEGERPILFLHVPQDDLESGTARRGQLVTMNLIRAIVISEQQRAAGIEA